MKIAFVDVTVTVTFGGIQTAVWELARTLHDLGHEITVFGGEGTIRPDLGGRSIAIHTFPFTARENALDLGSRFRRFWERWTFSRFARKTVIAGNFDWIILTKPFDFFWANLMPSDCPTRFCFMSGGTDFIPGDRYFSKNVRAFVACSHFNAWQISHRYKRHPKIIFNGVDTHKFYPTDGNLQLRKELGFSNTDIIFAFAGRLVGWKGIDIAIKALAEPMLARLPIKLLLIGDGSAQKSLESLARDLKVEQRVVFHPAIAHSELPRYYAISDAGVFPSIGDEAFGITIAEAMACGLPVIASHIGGIPEVVGNEAHSGLLAAAGDIQSFAAAMSALATDPKHRKLLGNNAAIRIANTFTWRHSALRLLDALQDADLP